MTTTKEPIPTFALKWGQLGLMLLAAAAAAVFAPIWLIYAGVLRFLWCLVGGQAGRGLASFAAFAAVYLAITFGLGGPDDRPADQPAERAENTTASSPTTAQTTPPHPPQSNVLTAASYRRSER